MGARCDRGSWYDMFGPDEDEDTPAEPRTRDADITYTHQELSATCRYGEETLTFNDPRPRHGNSAGSGPHTFYDVPRLLFTVLRLRGPDPPFRGLRPDERTGRAGAVRDR
ncbi:hypothetical protein ACIQ9P_38745 [Kitasatospora sp. NPDC094019]|uniref:hypothetical protein n=1 Tax=Kitasatospora sp. NPDC094019 TaxID=3364091 RepID=UPI00380B1E9C